MALLICLGIAYAFTSNLWPNPHAFAILSLIGSFCATIVCSLLNLLYFIPVSNNVGYLCPGSISIILAIMMFVESSTIFDLLFFLSFGVLNLILGIIWFFKTDIPNTDYRQH